MSNKKFTASFLSLMESLHSYQGLVHEDKETRKAKREERRQERREKRFEEKGDLKAFIQNLETLKSQIIANVVDTDHWIKQNPDSSVYPVYKKTFIDLLERVAKLMGDVIYISEKEGKKLETEDQELLTGLLETYNEIKTEYEGAAEKYSTASTQEVIEDQKKLKFKDISAKLIAAAKYFQEAAQENIKLLDTLKSGKTGDTENETKASDIKIESPIKKGAGSKKSPDEKVRSVQKAILDKFKNVKEVTDSQHWKNFARFKPDGIFGNATAGIIPALKAGFGMSDTTSDITQDFVNKLSEMKESLSESKIVSFSDFMMIKEDFNIEAFNKYVKENPATTTKKKDVPSDKEKELERFRKAEEEYGKEMKEKGKEEGKKGEGKKIDESKIKSIVWNIFKAMAGNTEDEEAVYEEFQKIESKEEFESVEKTWNNMKVDKVQLSKSIPWKEYDVDKMTSKNSEKSSGMSFRTLFKEYFSDGELARLNGYLPEGVKKI